MTPIVLIVLLF